MNKNKLKIKNMNKKKVISGIAITVLGAICIKQAVTISSLKKEREDLKKDLDALNQLRMQNTELVRQVKNLGYALGMEHAKKLNNNK